MPNSWREIVCCEKQIERLQETLMVWRFSYRWLFHCITFFWMLGWETRKKLIQEHRKRVVSKMAKKIYHYWETPRSAGLLSCSLASLKVANQEALIIRIRRIEGLWLDDLEDIVTLLRNTTDLYDRSFFRYRFSSKQKTAIIIVSTQLENPLTSHMRGFCGRCFDEPSNYN